jgi:hypothetical protein
VRQLNPLNPSAPFFHIVHASLMSQESKKFPLRSIPLCFVNLINMISTGRDWGKEAQTPSACGIPHRGATSLGTGYSADSRAGGLPASDAD